MISPGLLIRTTILGLLTVILQITVCAQLSILGGRLDLIPLVVVSVALLGGSITGSITGFTIGLILDLALLQTLGVSSLVYVGIGYVAGRIRELYDPQGKLLPLVAGGLATAGAIAGFIVMQFLLGVTVSLNGMVMREVMMTIVLNTLIAFPVFLFVRWVLRPSLPSEPRPGRGSEYAEPVLTQLTNR